MDHTDAHPPAEHPHRRRRGALAGVVATIAALGVAELVASAHRSLRSPILDVGARVIDAAPPFVKTFAVETFGTNDKPALIIGIAVFLVVYAVVIGVVATRKRIAGPIGVAAFALVGAWASVSGGGRWWSALPTLVGAAAGAWALWVLAPLAGVAPVAGDEPVESVESDEPVESVESVEPSGLDASLASVDRKHRPLVGPASRRTFLTLSAAIGAGAVVAGATGRWLAERFDVDKIRAALKLPSASKPLGELPAAADFGIDGLTPFVTPNKDFYRIDTSLQAPRVPVDSWSLKVVGMVENELEFTFDELAALDLIEADITLTCVSNEVGGILAGNARWLGVPLETLMKQARPRKGADQIVGRSTEGFTAGFPLEAALDGRDAIVAIAMNGEPLPVEHGFPARLVVPGLYGYVSATKWLAELELTTFAAVDTYWAQRGWAKQGPIKTFSRIDTPAPLKTVSPGTHPIAGVAWAQTRGISKVEVRVDGGEWMTAKLSEEVNNVTWRQWMLPFEFTAGSHDVQCRATDAKGAIQTEQRSEPIPDGASGWHSVVVLVG